MTQLSRIERARMTRKNRAYHLQSKKTTWKNLHACITARVQEGEPDISVLIKKIPYEFICILHAEGYKMYPNPNAKGQIIIRWEY